MQRDKTHKKLMTDARARKGSPVIQQLGLRRKGKYSPDTIALMTMLDDCIQTGEQATTTELTNRMKTRGLGIIAQRKVGPLLKTLAQVGMLKRVELLTVQRQMKTKFDRANFNVKVTLWEKVCSLASVLPTSRSTSPEQSTLGTASPF